MRLLYVNARAEVTEMIEVDLPCLVTFVLISRNVLHVSLKRRFTVLIGLG